MKEQYRVCAQAKVRVPEIPVDEDVHGAGNEIIPQPTELRICQIEGDPGFYLLYLDENGSEQTDSYHMTLKDAMAQAQWEYCVDEADWELVAPGSENLDS